MYLVVGLGNPGIDYEKTRHNIGFVFIDQLAEKLKISVTKPLFKSLTGKTTLAGNGVVLAKPQTYMNLSGNSVSALMNWFKLPLEGLIVVHDDIDLPPGKIRIKSGGGHGGQKGIESIISQMGTNEFVRLKIGVGRPQVLDFQVSDWVLGRFTEDENVFIKEGLEKALDAVVMIITKGTEAAKNSYN